jgi:hypothetical protein
MSQHDLATLLRDDIAATEPVGGLDAMVPLRLGRRRLRVRRVAGGVVVAALVTLAGTAPVVLSHDDRDHTKVTEPAPYDAEQMPLILDEHVRNVLERSVPDLGPVTFSAESDVPGAKPLGPGEYDQAIHMRVTYGPVTHRYDVFVGHAGSEAEGPVDQICANEVVNHLAYSCDVSHVDGLVVVTELRAYQPMSPDPLNDRLSHTLVRTDEVDQVPVDRRWFQRTVKVIKSDTLLTYVNESVRAPSVEEAIADFRVPEEDLVEIGVDPALAIPMPEAH